MEPRLGPLVAKCGCGGKFYQLSRGHLLELLMYRLSYYIYFIPNSLLSVNLQYMLGREVRSIGYVYE